MKRKTYDAPPIPSQLEHDQYRWGTLDVAYYFEDLAEQLYPQLKDSVFDIKMYMKWTCVVHLSRLGAPNLEVLWETLGERE